MKNLLRSVHHFLSSKFQTLFLEYKVDFKPRYGFGKPPHKELYEIINRRRNEYAASLSRFLNYKNIFHSIKTNDKETVEAEPRWNNEYLPGLDIISLYGLIRIHKPKQYIEIGSGNSTKVARKAINDEGLKTQITSVDPFPRASIDHLADTVIRQPAENMSDYSFIHTLQENDILFIDNSHRSFPNSDVTVCFLEILPKLRKGVVVHIHDIYLPYDYPQFMCDRFYSEQYLLATMLLSNPDRYQVLLPAFFVSEDAELSKILEPIWNHPNLANVERHGGSFWYRVN